MVLHLMCTICDLGNYFSPTVSEIEHAHSQAKENKYLYGVPEYYEGFLYMYDMVLFS